MCLSSLCVNLSLLKLYLKNKQTFYCVYCVLWVHRVGAHVRKGVTRVWSSALVWDWVSVFCCSRASGFTCHTLLKENWNYRHGLRFELRASALHNKWIPQWATPWPLTPKVFTYLVSALFSRKWMFVRRRGVGPLSPGVFLQSCCQEPKGFFFHFVSVWISSRTVDHSAVFPCDRSS